MEYEELLARGDPLHVLKLPNDEWDAISLNYTSGTTGNPKGVVSHHRLEIQSPMHVMISVLCRSPVSISLCTNCSFQINFMQQPNYP